MKEVAKLAFYAGVMVIGTGCVGLGYPTGSSYTGTTIPHAATRAEISGQGTTGDKAGEACATGILGIAAFGDASVDAAKKAGGISDVHSVEFRNMNILGLYSQGCTEIHGK